MNVFNIYLSFYGALVDFTVDSQLKYNPPISAESNISTNDLLHSLQLDIPYLNSV